MKKSKILIVLIIGIFLFNIIGLSTTTSCSSASDCKSKIESGSYDVVEITSNISGLSVTLKNDITIDGKGHTINGGLSINANGHNVVVRNVIAKGGSNGISIDNANVVTINNSYGYGNGNGNGYGIYVSANEVTITNSYGYGYGYGYGNSYGYGIYVSANEVTITNSYGYGYGKHYGYYGNGYGNGYGYGISINLKSSVLPDGVIWENGKLKKVVYLNNNFFYGKTSDIYVNKPITLIGVWNFFAHEGRSQIINNITCTYPASYFCARWKYNYNYNNGYSVQLGSIIKYINGNYVEIRPINWNFSNSNGGTGTTEPVNIQKTILYYDVKNDQEKLIGFSNEIEPTKTEKVDEQSPKYKEVENIIDLIKRFFGIENANEKSSMRKP